MFSAKVIQNIIKEYVQKGCHTFGIFPYGSNGCQVEDILKRYFSIDVSYIVDNEYFKFNKRILSLEQLKTAYLNEEGGYIFLTIEDAALNKKLMEQLCKIVPEECIVNLLERTKEMEESEIESTSAECRNGRFELERILPAESVGRRDLENTGKGQKNRSIKVRIFHSSVATWNAIASLCKACGEDEAFDFKIILSAGNIEKKRKQAENYPYIYEEEYDVSMDKPDVVFLIHHGVSTLQDASKYRENTKLIVVASMTLIRYDSKTIEEFENLMWCRFGSYYPDFWLFDTLLYREIIGKNYLCGQVIEMGNAKFDGIYEQCKNPKLPIEWEKLKNKRIVLWSTDHGIYNGHILKDLTFDLYAKSIFQYAEENKDIGIIFRPHPTFLGELLRNHYWSRADLQFLKDYINETDNIVWDENDTYDMAYAVSDAVLMDGHCGMICSALPLGKPIGVMYRKRGDDWLHPELVDCYYKVFCVEELLDFFEIVMSGQGKLYKAEARIEAQKRYIKHFDGRNGERIKAFVKEAFLSMQE